MKSHTQNIFLWVLLLGIFSCQTRVQTQQEPEIVEFARQYKQSMVVSARAEASTIGVEIMRKGGTAFDAMIATDLALAVCFPFAGNIGGGGFMVYRTWDGKKGTLDYRETAPAAAHAAMFLDSLGEIVPGLSTEGALAAGIPGTIAGLWETHQRFGTLPWKDLVQPAIDLAENGFVVTRLQAGMLDRAQDQFAAVNPEIILFLKDWKAGDTIRQTALANSLRAIRDQGRDGFYTGQLAARSVQFIRENGGIWTLQDLKDYQPIWRNAFEFKYGEYEVITMGLPSSGGLLLGQMLLSLEDFDLAEMGHNTPEYIHTVAQAMQRAYTDRTLLGDPAFSPIDVQALIDKTYLRNRMANTRFLEELENPVPVGQEKEETTHYSIVDSYGNAIAVTTTVNGAYGSKLYSNELGYFFNNEMDDFSAKPGSSNMFGLIGSEQNKIEPGKRMLSSMTPTILTKNNELYMVLGTPGGSTIITSVLQTILNTTVHGMTMQTAVSAPRFHHQWRPNELILEPGRFPSATFEELNRVYQYPVSERQSRILGKVDAIQVRGYNLHAGADPRGDDAAASVTHD